MGFPWVRQACVMSVTPLELALNLSGGSVGRRGAGVRGERVRRPTARAACDQEGQYQAIAELLTATIDLITSVQAVRAAYQQQTRWRHYIRVAAIVMAAIGSTMKSGERFSSDLLHWHRAGPGLERVLAADR